MKQKCVLFALLMFLFAVSFLNLNQTGCTASNEVAINGELVWEKTFGGKGDDRAFYATAIDDGFLVVGSSRSFVQEKTVAWVLRLDSEGNQLWNRTFPYGIGSEFRYIINLPDGFLLVGNEFSSDADPNGYVVKIDREGNMLWNITLGGGTVDRLFSAAKAQDGFLLAGLTENSGKNNDFNVWLVKINTNGNITWNKTYGWSMDDAGRSVALANDNSFLIAGYTNSTGHGNYDFLVLNVDNNGTLLWNQTYGGPESDKAYTIAPTIDGFVIAGDTRSEGAGESDALIIKIDSQGKLLWKKTVGGSGFDVPTCISALNSGEGYLVGGTTFSYGNGQRDFWLFKIDDSGNLLQSCTVGRSKYEESYATLEVSNDNFVMAGWTNSVGEGSYDFYVIKVKVENNIEWWQTNTFTALAAGFVVFLIVGLLLLKMRFNPRKREPVLNVS